MKASLLVHSTTNLQSLTSNLYSYAFWKDARPCNSRAGRADVRGGVGVDGELDAERGGNGCDRLRRVDVRPRPRHTVAAVHALGRLPFPVAALQGSVPTPLALVA